MRRIYYYLFTSLFCFLLCFGICEVNAEQSDTVKVPNVTTPPTIDGDGTDGVWDSVAWEAIDMVWMDGGTEAALNTEINSADFMGKYKALWSSSQNLLYVQVVTVDDGTFDFGYDNSDGSYPSWDCIEIFIDEDRSGGTHLMDGTGDIWGHPRSNGENAFAYHILPKTDINPSGTATTCYSMDLGGYATDNTAPTRYDYASHFDEFAVTKDGDTCTWELSIKIYDDTYDDGNPENSRVSLSGGKLMGFSVAYNDDDNYDGNRDNMYGSIRHTSTANQNASWYDADVFGVMLLYNDINNNAPTVANALKDTIVENLDAFIMVNDVNTIFDDVDGDNLNISASSADANLTVQISSDMLMIDPAPAFSGSSSVIVTASDGSESISDTFTVTYTPGGTDILPLSAQNISIYPIPADNYIQVNINNEHSGNVLVNVLDVYGKCVMTSFIEKSNGSCAQKFDLSTLRPGLYILNIEQGQQKIAHKIIIE